MIDDDLTTVELDRPVQSSGGPRGRAKDTGVWRPGYEPVCGNFGEVNFRRRDYQPKFGSTQEFEDARAEAALAYLTELKAYRAKWVWERAGTLKSSASHFMGIYLDATDLLGAAKHLGMPTKRQATLYLLPPSSLSDVRDLKVEYQDVDELIFAPDADKFAKAHANRYVRTMSRKAKKFWPEPN